MKRPLVIFSVADCLAKFADNQLSVSYRDGHLTCYVNGNVTNNKMLSAAL